MLAGLALFSTVALAQLKCNLPATFNSQLFLNKDIKCTPSGQGCTLEFLQANPTVCNAGYRPDPVLDFSQAKCDETRVFSGIVGTCVATLCSIDPPIPNAKSAIEKCNTGEGCNLDELRGAPIVCDENYGGTFDVSSAVCAFSSSGGKFVDIKGSCSPLKCKMPAQYNLPQYSHSCGSTCVMSGARTLKCASGKTAVSGAPINTTDIWCTEEGGTWSNVQGVCV